MTMGRGLIAKGSEWALVTGAGSGIGRSYALRLAAAGYRLVLVGNNRAPLESTAAEIRACAGTEVRVECIDLARIEAAGELFARVRDAGIDVDVLINNAGMFSFLDILQTPDERIERLLLLHDLTLTRLCRLFAREMVRRDVRGHILNMSSYSLWMPFPGLSLYSASKAYVRSFSVAFAKEVREYGIRVTAVCPAGVATDLYGLPPRWQRIGLRLGVLISAGHPALKSLALISIVGMSAVVLVAYTVQPILFRLLISGQTARGGYPYTLAALLNTLYAFVYFLAGCLLLQLLIVVLHLLPLGRRRRKEWFHRAIYGFTRLFLATMFTTRTRRLNPEGETFARPAIIVANHQSFIDILLLLSTAPKLVMVTNSWVWRSPFFGRIVRYAGFRHAADGYDALAESLREDLADGYSAVIFPEGTRSEDGTIRRFHKGAFLLAERLGADLVPVLIYGAGQISPASAPKPSDAI